MRKLHLWILKSYLGPFLMSFAVILFILVVQFMALYIDKIAGKGVGPDVLAQLFFYAAARLAITALPIAILSGALITFGGMGEHYELAAIKSCGISLFRLMRPTIFFGILVTGVSLWTSFNVIPKMNLKFFSLLYDVSRKKPDVAIQPGHFYSDIDGYVIRVSNKNKDNGILYDVMIYDHSENRGNIKLIVADSATTEMQERNGVLKMRLYNGSRHEEYKPEAGKPNNFPYGRTYFDSLYYVFNLRGFELNRTDEKQFRHQIIMPVDVLKGAIDSLIELRQKRVDKYLTQLGRHNKIDSSFMDYAFFEHGDPDHPPYDFEGEEVWECLRGNYPGTLIDQGKTSTRSFLTYMDYILSERKDDERMMRRYQYELYNRYAMPVNCVLFMLLGVSLGAIIRKGGLGAPSIISLILFMTFYILITQGKKMSKEGIIDPASGAWLPVMVFLPLAVYLTIQATRDAKILDESVWAMIRDKARQFFTHIFQRNQKGLAKFCGSSSI